MRILRSVLKSQVPKLLPDHIFKHKSAYQELSGLVDAARYPDAEAGEVVHRRVLAGSDQSAAVGPLWRTGTVFRMVEMGHRGKLDMVPLCTNADFLTDKRETKLSQNFDFVSHIPYRVQ